MTSLILNRFKENIRLYVTKLLSYDRDETDSSNRLVISMTLLTLREEYVHMVMPQGNHIHSRRKIHNQHNGDPNHLVDAMPLVHDAIFDLHLPEIGIYVTDVFEFSKPEAEKIKTD